uniref:Beta-1,4-glucuronyltransferase 1 n=1 Tax=Strigops habroptila TaxID=2489341 RepID=A0A672V6S2_STRHB
MGRGRLLGGCAWLLGGLALLQTLYLRALPPPVSPRRVPKPLPPPRGVLDASGTFRVYRDVLGPPPRWAPPELVLATHGTPGRAAAALGGALGGERWGGPLSVAVFGVPRAGLGQLLAALGGPCRGLRGRLRLHVVLGAADPPPAVTPNRGPAAPGGCRGALGRLAAADPPSYTLGVPYPGNLLRNVAWAGAAGEETGGLGGTRNGGPGSPGRGLREGFLRALQGGGPPLWGVVFVLPAFEVRLGTPVPGTKAELQQLWGTGDARPFYGALCPRCQAPTDYGRWWALPPTPHLRVAYEAPWRDPWEPFYVGPAHGVPPFDERFLQYGFNRISQACELHVAGFRFAVLDGAFVVHGGFKEADGFHGGRAAEQHRNRLLFRRFRSDLRLRYPRSPRRC